MPGDTQPRQRPQANLSLNSDFSFFFLFSLPFFFLYAPGVNKRKNPVARKNTLYMKPFTPSQAPGFVHEKFSVKTLYFAINIEYVLGGGSHIWGCWWNEKKPHQNKNPHCGFVTNQSHFMEDKTQHVPILDMDYSICLQKRAIFFIQCTQNQTTLAIVVPRNYLNSMELLISLWFLSHWTTPTSHNTVHQASRGNSWCVNNS